jgi:hypothetical protein
LIHPLNLNQLAYLPRFTSSCGSSGGSGGGGGGGSGGGGRNGNSGEVAVAEMISSSSGVQMMISTEQQLLVDNSRAANDANHPAYVLGSTARLLATLATTAPLELIRTRQISFTTTRQTRNGGTSTSSSVVIPSMMEEFKLLTRTRGISPLYAGLASTLWRDVPFSFYVLFFE